MQAATIRDGEIIVQEHPDPVPGTGEVLVRVKAAGLNAADQLQKRGMYPAPAGSPQDIPGLEFAGEVEAVGEAATRFQVGQRVMGIVGGGGQAELIAVHERQVLPVPKNLDWAQAGAFSEAFLTAFDAIVVQADLRPGERLLINGAAGGVGTAAVQIAKAIAASATASVRNANHEAALQELGATEVLVQGQETQPVGRYDVILELVGAPNMGLNVKSLNAGGRIVVIGVGAGFKAEVDLLRLMSAGGKLMGSTLRARPLEQKAALARRIEKEILPLVQSGVLKVPVSETFELADAAKAYDQFAAGGKFGKLVLINP